MRAIVIRLSALLLSVAIPGIVAAAENPAAEPRSAMSGVFEVLAALLPVSFDREAFTDPDHRNEIREKLLVLAASTHELQAHAIGSNVEFQFRSTSLANDAGEVLRRYDRGRFSEAQFYLGQLVEHCVDCHSRLPGPQSFELSEGLLSQPSIQSMEPRARARLYVATRRFDSALGYWEARLADPAVSPGDLDVDGELLDYLTVCVRVKGDFDRARRALENLAARADVPRYLRYQIGAWAKSLAELASFGSDPGVERARQLIERAHLMTEFPADRTGLIHDLVASSVLYRLVNTPGVPEAELAEAFYLLGGIEARTSQTSWVSSAEFHLEAAIRMAPRAAFAEKAYALLEEYTLLGYGGSSGVHLPPEVQGKLEELRGLIDTRP